MKPDRSNCPDAVVIGGGVAGLACARALARGGAAVRVYEPFPGRGASWAAAGMLSPWAEADAPEEAMAARERAHALYPAWIAEIEEESGLRVDFTRCGSLAVSVAGAPTAAERLRPILGRAPGAAILDREMARLEAPILGIGTPDDAVLLPEEGMVDPRGLMDALARSCKLAGVVIREEPVFSILTAEERAVGVRAASGDQSAGCVVAAAGAWSNPFLAKEDVRPIRGQILALAPGRDAIRVRRVIQSGRCYIVPRRDGSVVLGSTSEDAGFDPSVTVAGVRGLIEAMLAVAPGLADWTVTRAWAGLRPLREEGPCVGADPERKGLYHAAGLYRHGILLAPWVAERIMQEMER